MEKIDRELLIKEIGSRLSYGIKAQVLGWNEEKGEVEVPLRIYSINTDGYVYFETNDYDVNYLRVDECLLYLRPMSSMTEEEIKTYQSLQDTACSYHYESGDIVDDFLYFDNNVSLDYLNSIHFDYRGLIEKGLALEAPEGMYNIK